MLALRSLSLPFRSSWSKLAQIRTLKEIRVHENDKETVIEGVKVESERAKHLLDVDRLAKQNCSGISPKEGCHPLCRLPFVHEIKHTDVLILSQFMREDGHIMDRDVTGLCRRQHKRMDKLIRMAAKAGLFPKEKDIYAHEKEDAERSQWSKFNTYWDEKTIDIQWRENQKQSRIQSFKK